MRLLLHVKEAQIVREFSQKLLLEDYPVLIFPKAGI